MLVAIFMVIGFLFTSSTAISMSLHMDDCTVKVACENCCLISVPELPRLKSEYSFFACLNEAFAHMPDPVPLPFYHPPQ